MLKVTYTDLAMLAVGMIAGNAFYEFTKDQPNWAHVLELAWFQSIAFVNWIIFTKISGNKE